MMFSFFQVERLLAQNTKIDSLVFLLQSAKVKCPSPCIDDTSQINYFNAISNEFRNIGENDSALRYAKLAIEMSEKKLTLNKGGKTNVFYSQAKGQALNNIGVVFKNQGKYDKAIESYFEALKINQEIKNKRGIADNLGNVGLIYWKQGDYPKALEYYFKALKTNEEIDRKNGIAADLSSIGIIYREQGNFLKALEYYFRALKISEEMGDKRSIAVSLTNIGNIYNQQKNYSKGIEYYLKALKMNEEIGRKSGVAINLSNIGSLYDSQKNYSKALEYYFKALEINKETGLKGSLTINLGNIGSLFIEQAEKTADPVLKQKLYDNAEKYLLESLSMAKEIGSLDDVMEGHRNLSELYFSKGKFKNAFEHQKQFVIAKDSLFSIEKERDITRKEMKFEFEKKELVSKAEQEKTAVLYKAEVKQHKTQRNAFIGGFALVLLLAVVSFRGYRQKQKANKLLGKQKDTILEKNKDIMDSIHYANRIQAALLKEQDHVTTHLPPHFILFKPKDILSGDFYWSFEKQDHLYVAAADCTGHGVPGAMMSMLGIAFLNEITGDEKLQTPAEILDQLRDKIIKDLKSKDGVTKDGMDISLIRLNLKSNELQWAGANNPLWIMRSANFSNLIEIKADKQPIGFSHEPKPFKNHNLTLVNGDILYLFTDGYADQFGGEKGKKFKYGQLKDLILSICDKPLADQKEILNSSFEQWKGNLEQVDDVCVIGVKI